MSYTVTKIPAFRTDAITRTSYPKKPSLETLQAGVGGLIQAVPNLSTWEGRRAEFWCNEEGLINGLPPNSRATAIWTDALMRTSKPFHWEMARLFGDVIIVQKDPKPVFKTPQEALAYHVTGAIERGEGVAIVEKVKP